MLGIVGEAGEGVCTWRGVSCSCGWCGCFAWCTVSAVAADGMGCEMSIMFT